MGFWLFVVFLGSVLSVFLDFLSYLLLLGCEKIESFIYELEISLYIILKINY